MDNFEEILDEIIYEKSQEETIEFISSSDNSKLLHMIALNYNWDDGFDIPLAIVNNEYCDLGTALLIFECGDGYCMFDYGDEECEEMLDKKSKHFKFISSIKSKIDNNEFKYNQIKHTPELSRSEKYRLKKYNSDINSVFIDGTDGEEIN